MWLQVIAAVSGTAVIALVLGELGKRATARRAAAWEEAARQLGLRFELTVDGETLMRGELAGQRVRIFEERDRSEVFGYSNRETVFTVIELGPIPWMPRLALIGRPRSIRTHGRALERLESGDARFDAVVHVLGPRTELLPLLDYDARRALLLGFDQGDVRVESRRLVLRKLGATSELERLVLLGRRVQAIVAGLDPEGRSPVEQLAKTARREPVEGARAVALTELALRYPDDPVTRELAAELSRSGLAARRVMALDLLGAAGIPVAEGVVRDANADEDTRGRAREFLRLHGREPGQREQGRLSVVEEGAEEAEGRLSHAAQDGELALAED